MCLKRKKSVSIEKEIEIFLFLSFAGKSSSRVRNICRDRERNFWYDIWISTYYRISYSYFTNWIVFWFHDTKVFTEIFSGNSNTKRYEMNGKKRKQEKKDIEVNFFVSFLPWCLYQFGSSFAKFTVYVQGLQFIHVGDYKVSTFQNFENFPKHTVIKSEIQKIWININKRKLSLFTSFMFFSNIANRYLIALLDTFTVTITFM